jgi:hypothetical protein
MDKDLRKLKIWEEYKKNVERSTPVDLTETATQQRDRIARLEADPEAWIKYYFPKFAKYDPAPFHKASAARIIAHPEWVEVISWSRELAKSTRTMMVLMYLVMVGNTMPDNGDVTLSLSKGRRKKRNVLIISNSYDNAERLLLPYMANFESNNRLIKDYGHQKNLGEWEAGEFITKGGAAFRALGAGQSPRGTRNEEVRPDVIVFDDLDTDEDCLNPDTIDKHWEWVTEAVIPTRSISEPLLTIWCGNIIAEDCCVVRAQANADHVDIVNIRDAEGKSTWPNKNTEEQIDRVLSTIPYSAQQKEYFNNPMKVEKTFSELTWGKCPPLKALDFLMIYSDPSPSNRDMPGQKTGLGNSRKATFVVGHLKGRFYIYFGFLDVMSNRRFVDGTFTCRDYCKEAKAYFNMVENNTLQDPFFQQVLKPLVAEISRTRGYLPITPDTRDKPDKWTRIEGTLEPINTAGNLIFNEDEKGNPNMQRLEAHFRSAKPSSKQLDGPDCIEGAVWQIQNRLNVSAPGAVTIVHRRPHHKRM